MGIMSAIFDKQINNIFDEPQEKSECSFVKKTPKLKGIILAGGNATRLYPLTFSIPKSLLPLYNKPTIYYPLNTLKSLGCEEILIICKPEYIKLFQNLLQDGSQFGLNIQYKTQAEPKGIAEAFIIGKDFIGNDNVALCLGDNVFLQTSSQIYKEPYFYEDVFCRFYLIQVENASKYGVYDEEENEIYEKPTHKKYSRAIPGLYIFDHTVCEKAKSLKPSKRGELEITDLLKIYIKNCEYHYTYLEDCLWIDTGNYDDLLDAGNLIKAIEKRTGKDTCDFLFEKNIL